MRVALVAGPDPGHAFPTIALARAMRDRGHDVSVATGDQWREPVEREGLRHITIPLLQADERDSDFGFRMWGRGEEMAPKLAAELAAVDPELVTADSITVPGSFAAGLLRVPWVEVVVHLLQLPSRALPPIGAGLMPGRWPHTKLRDAVLRRLTARSVAGAREMQVAARRRLGLPDQGPPRMRLLATLPGLEWPRPDWPPRTHVVGPLEYDPATTAPEVPPGDGPLVFVADSTAWHRERSLLDIASDALAPDVRVVATRFRADELVRPANVRVSVGRQVDALDQSDAVLCSGGHGLLAKALVRGVPVVVVPGPGDQRENGLRLQAAGAGLLLPANADDAAIARAVRRVIDEPAFREGARKLADGAKGLGADHAAELVERVR